jgi:diguanylate cyclase (GGDEF)-like protein
MRKQNQQDALEIELIRSLFEARGPAITMTACFLLGGGLAAWQTGDPILILLLIAGAVTSAGRIALLVLRTSEVHAAGLTISRARQLQGRFSLAYFGFAVVLGMFGERAMQLPWPELHTMAVCLLVGYAAGVASGITLRPHIALPCMLVATVPAMIAMISKPEAACWVTALLTAGFLNGGVRSVRRRHARAVKSIGRRIAFSTLARQDGLTALPNRLALREWFDEHVASAPKPGMVALHYLDLNGFKPVNDKYGHVVGDALLVAASERIDRTIGATDMAARLGGDEFAVVQYGLANAGDAALLAERLANAIALPFQIEGNAICVSTCVGYVVSDDGQEDLEYLINAADEALYASKRSHGGVTRWLPTCAIEHRAAA